MTLPRLAVSHEQAERTADKVDTFLPAFVTVDEWAMVVPTGDSYPYTPPRLVQPGDCVRVGWWEVSGAGHPHADHGDVYWHPVCTATVAEVRPTRGTSGLIGPQATHHVTLTDLEQCE